MAPLPDEALVVRGGANTPESFSHGSGVSIDPEGTLTGVSVNAAVGVGVEVLTAPMRQTGYPGIPHNQVGVTTVGAIRACGGDVVPSPTRRNPNHATLTGITPEQASRLFRPTRKNPGRQQKPEEQTDGNS
jgi:hypothetical protein